MIVAPKINLCQYPTTTVLVDDNEDFLRQICEFFAKAKLPYHCFTEPQQALQFLNEEYTPDPFTNHCITTSPDRDYDNYISHLDIRKVYQEVYNPQRHSQVSVLEADYAMPKKNGLDLCRRLKDEFMLKLLLTGEAGPNIAIEGFNEDSIDRFLQKNMSLSGSLINAIHELQYQYFRKLSEGALSKVKHELYRQAPACLSDTAFVEFFDDMLKKHHVIEYYLLDEHGSFLFLDMHATPSWLVVKSEYDMEGIVDYASYQRPLKDVMEALQNRSKVPYFDAETDGNIGYDDAESRDYMHPATKLIASNQTYYYSYVTNPKAYPLERHRIVSFAEYLKNNRPKNGIG